RSTNLCIGFTVVGGNFAIGFALGKCGHSFLDDLLPIVGLAAQSKMNSLAALPDGQQHGHVVRLVTGKVGALQMLDHADNARGLALPESSRAEIKHAAHSVARL